MIPRYHPQITLYDIIYSLRQKNQKLPLDVKNLGLPVQENSVFWLNSATSALYVALKALNLPPDSGIGVPIYSCVTVFQAIASAGMKCVFLDVKPDDFTLDTESLRQQQHLLSAVIIIHTFGFPSPFDEIRKIMGQRPIIEDCAHALGSQRESIPLGLAGSAAVYSFNTHKPISANGGGLLIVNDKQYINSVRAVLQQQMAPIKSAGLNQFLKPWLKVILYRSPWYGLLVALKLLDLRRDSGPIDRVRVEPMSVFQQRLLARLIKSIPLRWKRQRDWASELAEMVGKPEPVRHYVAHGEMWNGYLWPILLASSLQRELSLEFLHRAGVDAFVLWPDCFKKAARFGYKPGLCPQFEKVFPKLLFLPCYAELTRTQKNLMRHAIPRWQKQILTNH